MKKITVVLALLTTIAMNSQTYLSLRAGIVEVERHSGFELVSSNAGLRHMFGRFGARIDAGSVALKDWEINYGTISLQAVVKAIKHEYFELLISAGGSHVHSVGIYIGQQKTTYTLSGRFDLIFKITQGLDFMLSADYIANHQFRSYDNQTAGITNITAGLVFKFDWDYIKSL